MLGAVEAKPQSVTYDPGKFAPAKVNRSAKPSGEIILTSPLQLPTAFRNTGAMLDQWAAKTPNGVFLAERNPDGTWRRVTFGQALELVSAIARNLLARGLGEKKPVVIIADNSIDHALLVQAALYVGVPVAQVSTAYARISQDFEKLRHILSLVEPGLVFIDDPAKCQKALAEVDFGAELVFGLPADKGTAFSTLLTGNGGVDVAKAAAAVLPDTVAKILFTSGSTGLPKGVINTQRMICCNQEMAAEVWRFLRARPPVLVDWLPWNHTFGSNFVTNLVLRHGGTLHIDAGKPAPGLIDKTVANLREVQPTVYFNVPKGFAMLLDNLEADAVFRDHFFAELDMLLYAGASLPQSSWERLEKLALASRGKVIPIIGSWGLTETAPFAVGVHYPVDRAGIIGLPAPGVEIKLVPTADKMELRVRGPNVTPGYYKRPDLATCYDEEGYYCTGDAAVFVDPNDPDKGLVFDGRIAENFKLSSGTWVNVGALRVQVITAAAPLVDDAVVTGHDRDDIGLLIFPNVAACRKLAGLAAEAPFGQVIATHAVRDAIAKAVQNHNRDNKGSSSLRVRRAMLMVESASIDGNEITDKGYINQRAVLTRRANFVEALYSDPADTSVITID